MSRQLIKIDIEQHRLLCELRVNSMEFYLDP